MLFGILLLFSCRADQICASYQSYFLVSAKEQPSVFSFQEADSMKHHEIPDLFAIVDEDGLPRRDLPNTVKDKNGLVKSEWAVVRNWKKRIVPMEVMLPEVDDSVKFGGDDIMFAERDVIDSVALDSARNAAQSVRYNNDQRFYNWYFRDKLAWADDASAQQQEQEAAMTNEEEKEGFFKRIFRKKDKEPSPDEAAGGESLNEQEPAEKKGFFKNLFKKKEKAEENTTESQL